MAPLLLPALFLALPAALPQDRVLLADGGSEAGRVSSATLDEITLEDDGEARSIPAAEVVDLRFGALPASLTRAEEMVRALDYANAVNLLDAATAEPDPTGAIAGLRKAEALLAWSAVDPSQAGEAVAAFQGWLAEHADHFFVPRARIGLARAMARSGQVDQAAQELEQVASLAFEKSLPKTVEYRARLARCRVYLEGGQAGIAVSRLQDLVPRIQGDRSSSDLPTGVRRALGPLLTEGRILLGDAIEADQGISAAESYWQGLLRSADLDGDVRAAATLGLAKAARAGGQLRRAQLLAARVVATMPAGREVSARALYLLGELTAELGDDIAASRPYFRRVADLYPETVWAVRAREQAGE
ncbi:MAG: hypothetical protein D6702_02815 [Planctomycetota bacterium]|nr:MAG: hypothetical protein D6702_02815 [Planctomycetota bacterium]